VFDFGLAAHFCRVRIKGGDQDWVVNSFLHLPAKFFWFGDDL